MGAPMPAARQVVTLKELPGLPRSETGLSGDVHRHHLIPIAIEQLPPVVVPLRLAAAIGRDLPLAARARIGPYLDFLPARLLRAIGKPTAIGGQLRGALFPGSVLQQSPRLTVLAVQ